MRKIPHHLGIIIDGNRRWAKERGLPALEGHRRGLERLKELIDWSKERGIKVLTLFVFSTENWKRSKVEVNYLIRLFGQALSKKNIQKIHQEGIKIRVIGQRERLPGSLQKTIKDVEELTKSNKGMVLNFALSYGGRAEIVEAIKNVIKKKIPLEKITEDMISQNLWTSDVDLIIRTGKEQRISNFLIWQAAYSELYFCPKYWPEFSEKDLDRALQQYACCQRRFGK
ncbi:MAG: di-trans,poly-cis-decaprenylcistransferase [Candidatus Nealsonbacteria bacterium CG18_big_fil_WC_8_21_14_2_50_37_10]|uniref:Isoprenyl transferase n=1 Tax=Candidatus Nealsonbacteria bacterium CG18_big_fil_WC_8_21_14_2_50_37_10 TaxID=1974717 RepID=A0A2H0FI47_9BACT|nr:MAG: di-trans,poly-cis-decaprenylcistransferase [Candidatus Nealsonbacteria bacterium CG18_big_fil_WC_8_21_14_2_50_37_10]